MFALPVESSSDDEVLLLELQYQWSIINWLTSSFFQHYLELELVAECSMESMENAVAAALKNNSFF